jgi:hypothetical protein
MARIARKTDRFTKGINGLTLNTCPSDEMIQRPVERQAKKT